MNRIPEPLPDVFISYAREDRERIEPLARALTDRGVSVFWDRDIPTGQTWRSHIGQALMITITRFTFSNP